MRTRTIARVTAVTLMGLAVLVATGDGFAQSYAGLYGWAIEHGLSGKADSFPLLVDTFVGVGELGVFLLAIDGHRLTRSGMAWLDLFVPALVAASGWTASLIFHVGHTRPGMYYLAAPTVPEDKHAIPARGYLIDDAQMREHAATYPASVRPLDEVTVKAAGEVYANRTAPAALVDVDAPAPAGLPDDDGQGDDEQVGVIDEYAKTPDPDPTLQAGPYDEITVPPDDEGFTFAERAEKMPPDEAFAELLAQLAVWADEGREEFAPRDLRPIMDRTGYGRAWIQKQLKRLVEDDEVLDHGDRGTYVIIKAPTSV